MAAAEPSGLRITSTGYALAGDDRWNDFDVEPKVSVDRIRSITQIALFPPAGTYVPGEIAVIRIPDTSHYTSDDFVKLKFSSGRGWNSDRVLTSLNTTAKVIELNLQNIQNKCGTRPHTGLISDIAALGASITQIEQGLDPKFICPGRDNPFKLTTIPNTDALKKLSLPTDDGRRLEVLQRICHNIEVTRNLLLQVMRWR